MTKKVRERVFQDWGKCPICSKLFEDCPHTRVQAEKRVAADNERRRVEAMMEPFIQRYQAAITKMIEEKVAAAVAAEFARREATGADAPYLRPFVGAEAPIHPADPSVGH